MRKQVLALENQGILFGIIGKPVSWEDHGGKGGHDITDPLPDGFSSMEFSIGVLDIVSVFGKSVCPDTPVVCLLGLNSRFVVEFKGLHDFGLRILAHGLRFLHGRA